MTDMVTNRPKKLTLTLGCLREANVARLPRFKNAKGQPAHSKPDGSDWKLTEWVNATAGEVGEMAEMVLLAQMVRQLGSIGNTTKKVERGDVTLEEVRAKLADEMADVLTYLDILAFRAGIDLSAATIDKWNRISARVGVEIFIGRSGEEWAIGRDQRTCPYPGCPHPYNMKPPCALCYE